MNLLAEHTEQQLLQQGLIICVSRHWASLNRTGRNNSKKEKTKPRAELNNGDCESSANPTGVQNDNCGPASGPLVGVSSQLYD